MSQPTTSKDNPPLPQMSLLEHLEDLRRCLTRVLIALVIAFAICWVFSSKIFHFLALPVLKALAGEKLAFTGLADPFFLYMKVAFLAALFVSSPYILFQLWKFVAPGLYPKERKMVFPFVFFTSLFFIAGGVFGYTVIFPLICNFFIRLGKDFRPVLTIHEYMSLATKLLLGMGLVFEMPILIFFLAKFRIVTAKFLIKKFKYAVVIIFAIAAIITPTPDMVTQTTLALPMLALYLLGVGIAAIYGKS